MIALERIELEKATMVFLGSCLVTVLFWAVVTLFNRPPEILSIEFPAVVQSGTIPTGKIHFRDLNGDIVDRRTEGDITIMTRDLEADVKGRPVGEINFRAFGKDKKVITCSSAKRYNVSQYLIDRGDNTSNIFRYSFICIPR